MGLFDFLFGKGNGDQDGSSPAKAVVVSSVGAEYQWIQKHCPGFTPQVQALQMIDGKPYDVLTLHSTNGGQQTVYFDISSFYGK